MENIILTIDGALGILQFNRPRKLNAMNLDMLSDLEDAVEILAQNDDLKVIVIKGHKSAFMAGGDLEIHRDVQEKQEVLDILTRGAVLFNKIAQLDVLKIAAVEGLAFAGACELITCCDFCFASQAASFQYTQIKFKLSTPWGGAGRLINKIGSAQALQLLLTGEQINAKKAKEIGYIDFLVSQDQFDEQLQQFIQSLLSIPSEIFHTYRNIEKKLHAGESLSNIALYEADRCTQLWIKDAHKEAVASYFSTRNV